MIELKDNREKCKNLKDSKSIEQHVQFNIVYQSKNAHIPLLLQELLPERDKVYPCFDSGCFPRGRERHHHFVVCKDQECRIYWQCKVSKPLPNPALTPPNLFMPPDRMIGGILFLSCLFVCLFICLSVVNFNLRYNFWTVRGRYFIFGLHTPLMMPFQMTPRSMTFWPWLWHLC